MFSLEELKYAIAYTSCLKPQEKLKINELSVKKQLKNSSFDVMGLSDEILTEEANRINSGYYIDLVESLNIFKDSYEKFPNQLIKVQQDAKSQVEKTTLCHGPNGGFFKLARPPNFPEGLQTLNSLLEDVTGPNCKYFVSEIDVSSDSTGLSADELDQLMSECDPSTLEFLMCNEELESSSSTDNASFAPDESNDGSESPNMQTQVAQIIDYLTGPELSFAPSDPAYPFVELENHASLLLHLEKQYKESVFYVNGKISYPVLTNKDFHGIGYDLSTEYCNNRVIQMEIFRDSQACSTMQHQQQPQVQLQQPQIQLQHPQIQLQHPQMQLQYTQIQLQQPQMQLQPSQIHLQQPQMHLQQPQVMQLQPQHYQVMPHPQIQLQRHQIQLQLPKIQQLHPQSVVWRPDLQHDGAVHQVLVDAHGNSIPLAVFENKSLEELKQILKISKSRRQLM